MERSTLDTVIRVIETHPEQDAIITCNYEPATEALYFDHDDVCNLFALEYHEVRLITNTPIPFSEVGHDSEVTVRGMARLLRRHGGAR